MFRLAFVASAPERIVDGGVLEQSGEDEDETDDEVDVNCLHVRDSRQRRAYPGTDGRHRQYRRYA